MMNAPRQDAHSVQAWKSPSLYIGDLKEDVTENDLLHLFSVYGPLESVKICRNWDSGQPLGYGFLNFVHSADAEKALELYNFRPVKGKPCRLMWSTKRSASNLKEEHAANVFVKGLDREVDNKVLFETFSICGAVLSSRVARNRRGSSLGYGYVSFASDSAAEQAVRRLNGAKLNGQAIKVEMFVEKSQRPEKPWSNIHVMGLPQNWNTQMLRDRFAIYGQIRSAVVICDDFGASRGFGFVDFENHESAKVAIEDSNSGLTRFAFVQDPLFETRLKVTPAIKKSEKSCPKVPRAGSVGSSSGRLPESGTGSRRSSYIGNDLGFFEGPTELLGGDFAFQTKLKRYPASDSTGCSPTQAEKGFFDFDSLLFEEDYFQLNGNKMQQTFLTEEIDEFLWLPTRSNNYHF